MSLPLGQDLQNQINVDRSATRVTATLKNVSTRQTQNLKARAEEWQRNTYPDAKVAEATGPSRKAAEREAAAQALETLIEND